MANFSDEDQFLLDWIGNVLQAGTISEDFKEQKSSYSVAPLHHELTTSIPERKGLLDFDLGGEIMAQPMNMCLRSVSNILPVSGNTITVDPLDMLQKMGGALAGKSKMETSSETKTNPLKRVKDEEDPSVIVGHSDIRTPSMMYSESSSIVNVEETRDLHLMDCVPDSTGKELMKLVESSRCTEEKSRPRDEPSGSSNDQSYLLVKNKRSAHANRKNDHNLSSNFLHAGVHHSTRKEPLKERRPKRLRRFSSSKDNRQDSEPKTHVSKTGEAELLAKVVKEKPKAETSKEYIHLRAKSGQATSSHSLAERARREKIRERMKILQELVPGCNNVTGNAQMLDEIINYIQSLQSQVEFLSVKLASLSGLEIDDCLSKEVGVYESATDYIKQIELASHELQILEPSFEECQMNVMAHLRDGSWSTLHNL